VIGVVALLVFGPKGLAEIARNLGSALRAFQPTIQELTQVSNEFKQTLEDELALDDLTKPAVPTPKPREGPIDPTPPPKLTDLARPMEDGDAGAASVTPEMMAASAKAAWGDDAPAGSGEAAPAEWWKVQSSSPQQPPTAAAPKESADDNNNNTL